MNSTQARMTYLSLFNNQDDWRRTRSAEIQEATALLFKIKALLPEKPVPRLMIRPKRTRAAYYAQRKSDDSRLLSMNSMLRLFAPFGQNPATVKYTHHHRRRPVYAIYTGSGMELESGFTSLGAVEEFVHAYIEVMRED